MALAGASRRPGTLALASMLVALTLAAGQAWAQDDSCSGHGQLVGGKCVCSAPLPTDAGPGFVGDQCATPVHRIFLNSQDVQDTCGEGHVCNAVAPGQPVCFATNIEEMADAAYHLTLLLKSVSPDAVITLRGLLTNFTSTTDPASGATTVAPLVYPNAGVLFSFAAHTSGASLSAQLQLSRRQLGYGAYTGMFLCAESNAATSLQLRGATNACPFTLEPLEVCSGRTDTCPHGMCACPPPYAPPPNWVMTPGLGFEDCSATLERLLPGSATEPGPPAAGTAAPGKWVFFALAVQPTAYELQVAAVATAATQGTLVLYLRYQQLPGEGEGQHDASSDVAPAGPGTTSPSTWLRELSARATLRRDGGLREGVWYVGAYNKGNETVAFALTANAFECPNNCSGRGTCDAATATCTCAEPATMLAPDCAASLFTVALGVPFSAGPRAFASDVLAVPNLHLRSAATSHLTITASFSTSDGDAGLPAWVTGRPLLLAGPAVEPPEHSSSPVPQASPVARLVLQERGSEYTLDVGPWMLRDDTLRILLWNPLASRLVGYTVAVAVRGSCLADCSGHGTCDASGLCVCEAPFAGGDCSIDLSQYNTTGPACTAGSLQPARVDEQHGTCWRPCKEDGSGFDDAKCESFTCDGPGDGHGPLRRKGSELVCVEDACVAGDYTVTDASGDFACTRACVCPGDGSACALEAQCRPGSVQCLHGLHLAGDGVRCLAPPACEEGALRRAFDIDGGFTYAVCACSAAGDPASCAFTAPAQAGSNAGGVVSCLPGYERQGAASPVQLSDGSTILTGGTCVRAQHDTRRRGTSGGMVFFWCLFSVVLAAGLVFGSKYGMLWYEEYRYGRSVFSQVSWPLIGNRANAAAGADDW